MSQKINRVSSISKNDFYKLFNVSEVDLVEKGLFTEEDYIALSKIFGYLKPQDRILHLLRNIPYALAHPMQMLKSFDQIISNQIKDIKRSSKEKEVELKDRYPISDYVMKASIASSFHPKTILEIGTYFGWGTSALKMASPEATVYTMNPVENEDANNPIDESHIGEVWRRKNLKAEQIWADSTEFNYKTIPQIDVTYIDGNHEYDFVYKDLENTSRITNKAIILDDYIPTKNSPRGDVRAWGPWNESVVKAVDDFLKDHPNHFSHAYWVENSPVCVLIK